MTDCWAFMPQRGVVESLEWLTDVIRCRSAEQRLCLRPSPRQEFSLNFRLVTNAFGRAKELAKAIGGNEFYLPIWQELSEVGAVNPSTVTLPVDSTHKSYFGGSKCIVWDSDLNWEICTVSVLGIGTIAINPGTVSSYANALVAPIRTVTFAQEFDADRYAADFVDASARFLATVTEDLSGQTGLEFPTYRTYPLIDRPAVMVGDTREQFEREVEVLDSGTGLLTKTPTFSQAIQISTLAWSVLTCDALWDLRVWLHSRKGRWKCFWVPSWNADLTITRAIAANDTTIEIADINYSAHYPSTADFAIITLDEGAHCFRVTDCDPGTTGHQILTIDTPMTESIALNTIGKTCRIVRSRFDADRVEIQHSPHTGEQATVAIPIVQVPL